MEVVTLLPLSQAQLPRTTSRCVDRAFAGMAPESLEAVTGGKRVQRDVRDISSIERRDVLPRLLRILAQHSGQPTHFTQLGGQIGLDEKTARKYLSVLEKLFLVRRLEPWHNNPLSRLVKTPGLHFLHSGLLAALSGIAPERVVGDRTVLGMLPETFVFTEVLDRASVPERQIALRHYLDKGQNEADIEIEDESGGVVGLEIKSSAIRPGRT